MHLEILIMYLNTAVLAKFFDCNHFLETKECCEDDGIESGVPCPTSVDISFTSYNLACNNCVVEPVGGGYIYFVQKREKAKGDESNHSVQNAVYPNPFTTKSVLVVEGKPFSNVVITLMDISGRIMNKEEHELSSNGHLKLDINTINWQAGVYFCQIKQNQHTETISLIKY